MVLGCIGLGMLLGALTLEAVNQPALAVGEDGDNEPQVIYKGPFRNIHYRVAGEQLQKALHRNEVVLYGNLLVFKENGDPKEAVSLYNLKNLNVTLGN
jgi:hypothetical protein